MKKRMQTVYKVLLLIVLIPVIIAGIWACMYFYRSDPSDIIHYETMNQFIYNTTQISAHRSGAGIMPEQTLMAFKNCAENDDFEVDFFEFDLHITKDDVLILLHDNKLDRTSDCEYVFKETDVRPEDKTYEELRMLNMCANFETDSGEKPYAELHGEEVPDEMRILSLDEILDYLTGQGEFNYIIEAKNRGNLGMKSVDILYSSLKEREMLDHVIFGCFYGEVSDYVDAEYPDMMRSAYPKEVLEFYIAALLNKSDFSPVYEMLQLPFDNISHSHGLNFGTAQIINYAHKNNLAVQYWTINRQEEMKYLISIGADGIISDYPDLLYSVRKSMLNG